MSVVDTVQYFNSFLRSYGTFSIQVVSLAKTNRLAVKRNALKNWTISKIWTMMAKRNQEKEKRRTMY